MILLIDNYDSFVHNLARYFRQLGQATQVVRNDAAHVDQLLAREPAAIVLSPGPCTPLESGVSVELVKRASGRVPILGICLGHQVIAAAFGGRIKRADRPVHGQSSPVHHQRQSIFRELPSPFEAGRYHSLEVDPLSLPPCLNVLAWTGKIIMAIEHSAYPIIGLQFHPESVLTEHGYQLLSSFLETAGLAGAVPAAGHRRPPSTVATGSE